MSLFTRSFRGENKHLLQYRPSILWPGLETFKINFKSFLYSFHIPSASSLFFIMKLLWPNHKAGVGCLGGVGWLGWVGGLGMDVLSGSRPFCYSQHCTSLAAASALAPRASSQSACCLADISLCLCSV